MPALFQPPLRTALQHAVCFFCLLRPLWGWMDRKADPESLPPPPAATATEPAPVRANGLGDWIRLPDPAAPRPPSGVPP